MRCKLKFKWMAKGQLSAQNTQQSLQMQRLCVLHRVSSVGGNCEPRRRLLCLPLPCIPFRLLCPVYVQEVHSQSPVQEVNSQSPV